jgi:hypothetical protein
MDELYNTIRATYVGRFAELTPKSRLHFASRLYLWLQDPVTANWLAQLRPGFTAEERPLLAVRQLIAEPAPRLQQTGTLRAPYFERYPKLRVYERVLFRLLFMRTLYGLETSALFDELFSPTDTEQLYEALLNDPESLARLSSFGVNFVYLLKRFVRQDESGLPLEQLLHVGQTGYGNDTADCRLQCYFYTHCIIGESLFYAQPVPPQHLAFCRRMLKETEELIERSFAQLKLDNLCEFLVCCRLLGYTSPLEARSLRACQAALSPEGYLVEPTDKRPPDLSRAEHRNVLFLMSQRPYQPLLNR